MGKPAVLQLLCRSRFGRSYLGDLQYRSRVQTILSLLANLLYAAFRMIVGMHYASVWFLSMAVYYLVLGCLRLSLMVSSRHSGQSWELRCYRRTAWLLFLLNIPMGGMILLMVVTNSGYSYPGYVIYLSALYTFYTLITAILNLVRFRRLGSPILSAVKVLNLVAALMSVLGLQTAMIAQFSADGPGFRKMMNTITGGCVWGIVIVIAVYMLVHSRTTERKVTPIEQIRK